MDWASIAAMLQGIGSLGGFFGGGGLSGRKQMALEFEYNKQLMQNQLQWRAQDAEKAGIHPLYAMGAPTATFSTSVGGGGPSKSERFMEGAQGLSRALGSYQDSKTRAITDAQQIKMNELRIKQEELALAKSASDLAISRSSATVPLNSDTLLPGQGNALVQNVPSRRTANRPYDMATEAAAPAPATREFINRDGSVSVWPSADAKNAIEDSLYEIEHFLRNRINPWFQEQGRSIKRAWDKTWWNPYRERR